MDSSLFRDSATYREINSYTHRLRQPDVNAPALTWHTAYWISDYYSGQFTGETPRDFMKKELDRVITSTIQSLSRPKSHATQLFVQPLIDGKIALFDCLIDLVSYQDAVDLHRTKRQYDILNSDNRAVTFGFALHGISYRFRFELHTEYFTITIIADSIDLGSPSQTKLKTALILIRHMISTRGHLDRNLERKLNEYIYEDFWRNFFIQLADDCGVEETYTNSIFRTIFGDFRGLVLTEKHVVALRRPPIQHGVFREWGRSVADGLLGFISHGRQYEGTASYVINRNGLYITALGPQLGENYDNKRSAVTFALCVRQYDKSFKKVVTNKVELGRLLQNLHSLGTTRVAALRDLKKLRRSSSLLARFEPLTRATHDRLREIVTDKNSDGETQKAMSQIYEAFTKIGADLVDTKSKNMDVLMDRSAKRTSIAPGGLQYRVERSRYYVSEFDRNLFLLDAMRVEGYQTYGEFIQRRLRGAYEFINRLGVRFERALAALTSIEQNYLALRADKTEHELRKIAEEVNKIQKYGEFILLAVLVPYYLIATFNYVSKAKDFAQLGYVVTWGLMFTIAVEYFYSSQEKEIDKSTQTAGVEAVQKRLLQFNKRRRRLARNLFAQPILQINSVRNAFRKLFRNHKFIFGLQIHDKIMIAAKDTMSRAAASITPRSLTIFSFVIAIWYLVVLPIFGSDH